MGADEGTPSWFWPVFAIGMTFALTAIVASGIGGAWLMGNHVATAVPSQRPHVSYAPPVVPYAPPVTPMIPIPAMPAMPPVATIPQVAPSFGEPYVGDIAIELVVRESHGLSSGRAHVDQHCLLALSFDGVASGEGRCHGTLTCEGDRPLWSAGRDQAFACEVHTDLGTLEGDDPGGLGRPALSIRSGGDGATVSIAGTARGRPFSVLATSE